MIRLHGPWCKMTLSPIKESNIVLNMVSFDMMNYIWHKKGNTHTCMRTLTWRWSICQQSTKSPHSWKLNMVERGSGYNLDSNKSPTSVLIILNPSQPKSTMINSSSTSQIFFNVKWRQKKFNHDHTISFLVVFCMALSFMAILHFTMKSKDPWRSSTAKTIPCKI